MKQTISSEPGEPRILIYEDVRLSKLSDPTYHELEILVLALLSSAVGLLVDDTDGANFSSAGGYFLGRIFALYIKNHPE